MKKLLNYAFLALFLFVLSCEEKDSKPKCSFTFQGTKYSTNVSTCFDATEGFYAGSMINGFEWNFQYDPTNGISLSIEIIGGILMYVSVANLDVTKSGNTYTFSADLEEIDTQEEGTISGVCTCNEL